MDRRCQLAASVVLSAWLLSSCSSVPTPGTSADASSKLRELLEASDEAELDRNPIYGIFRGDLRRAAVYGDYVSEAYVAAEKSAAANELRELTAIPRERLTAPERIAYNTFRWSRADALEKNSPPASLIWPRLTLDHHNGWHVFFPEFSSGDGIAPYRTVQDYENGLVRIDGFVEYLDRAVSRMREGISAGVVQPRFVVDRMIVQFERFAEQGPETSPYCGPIRKFPTDMAPADRERFTKAYMAAVEAKLRPAFRRVHSFMVDGYRRAARDSVGLSAIPGGAPYYEYLVRSHTTTLLTARQIHDIGLAEVARITKGMQTIMQGVGFGGGSSEFFEYLRTDRLFQPVSAAAVLDGYRAIGSRVDAAIPRLFDVAPKTLLEIRPTPDYQAPTDAAARYNSGAPDTGKPGVFYVNTYDLKSRSTWMMEALYLHEAVPGHHFQSMLAVENTALPKLLRFGWNTAYGEGWALYAESLGPELGLFEDPYQLFGYYDAEMLRAMRLVVDTGLHAFGWTREQAIDYMLAHSAMGRTDVVAEVERYIVNPGQALAYKIGALTIQRLRRKAEQQLGARFDVRAFHSQVLMTGAIPMTVLETRIDDWIASFRPSK
jgi:uncharacterized protein (DUF885 family)